MPTDQTTPPASSDVTPQTARALVVPRHGGSDALSVTDREIPAPGPGEVRVQVAASGVNFIDVYQREGVYPIPTPFTLGVEMAGTVEAVGEGVDDVQVGDRVAQAMNLGSHAELAVFAADRLVPVPDDVDLEVAAAAMLQGCTAHFLVTDTFPVGPDTTALVHAAAGGVGQLLVQLIKAQGGTVVATAGSPDKLEIARSRGADHLIDYSTTDDLAAAVREATGGRGVDVVYDGVGQATFDASLASLRPRGMLVLFGAASGAVPPVDPQRLNAAGSAFLTRPSLAHYVSTTEELRDRAAAVFAAIGAGQLDIAVSHRYPLSDAKAAYDALEGRETTGKVVLLP